GINLNGLGKVRLKDFAVEIVIDLVEKVVQPVENVELAAVNLPIFQHPSQLAVLEHLAVFRDADEDNPVEQPLHHLVQLPGGEFGIVLVNVLGEFFPPARHLIQEDIINLLSQTWRTADFREQSLQR